MTELEESLKGLLPLYDVLERIAYIQAILEKDKDKLKELEKGPNIEEIREELN